MGPRIIAVGGGKGGVGKSLIAGNVAVALADAGHRVVLVDADLGAANQHTLFGIDRPSASLQQLLSNEVKSLEEIAMPTRIVNLRLVVGTGAVLGAANINHGQKVKVLRQIRKLDTDVVVVDVGAGTSHNTVDFFDIGDVRVVVVTPQLTSIQNAYAFLKAAVLRLCRHTAEDAEKAALFDGAVGQRETERVDEILKRLDAQDAAFAARLRGVVGTFDARLVGNMVTETNDLGIFQGVARMVRDFLGVPAQVACHLRTSRFVHQSVNRRVPFLAAGVDDDNARILRRFALTLMHATSPLAVSVPSPGAAARNASAPAKTPEDLLRHHDRLSVTWSADLIRDGQSSPVRVTDVSAGGVGIETSQPLAEGERCTLFLLEPGLRLEVPTRVRHLGPSATHAGLAFEADGDLVARILAAARQPGGPGAVQLTA